MKMTRLPYFVASVLVLGPLALRGQQTGEMPAATVSPTAAAVFTSTLGQTVVKGDEGAATDYAVLATQPVDSKLVGQKIELRRMHTDAKATSTHTLVVYTGKYRSVASMSAFVAEIFRRFLAGGVQAGQEAGKIGDLRYGGEIHFVVTSPDRLDYQVATQNTQKDLGSFSRADVQTFLTILPGPAAKP